jgi:hypothetical protein
MLTSVIACAGEPRPLPDRVVDALSLADVRQVVEHAGGKVTEVKETTDGLTVETDFPNGLQPWYEGMQCKGYGESRRCTEFKIGLTFKTESAARAAKLESRFNLNWIAAAAKDEDLIFARMDFTYGGMPIRHLEKMFEVLMDIGLDAEKVIWPPEKNQKAPPQG